MFLVLTSTFTFAQSTKDISILRFNDNNASIKADESDWGFHRIIKEIELGPDGQSTLSVGGDVRLQFYQNSNCNFGMGAESEHWFWQRYLLHADLNLSNTLRVFTQFGSTHTTGREYIIPEIEKDKLDVMQVFADIKLNIGANLNIRLGRQEFTYGTAQMLHFRGGPNNRQGHDGIRITLQKNGFTADFLAFRPVINKFGVFDNKANKGEYSYGTYLTYTNQVSTVFDLYYLGTERKSATYINDDNTHKESRQSVGFRISQSNKPFFHNTEITYQFGKFGDSNISAFEQFTKVGYQFKNSKWQPLFQLKEFIYSGDKNENDGKINTFRTISSMPSASNQYNFGNSNTIILIPEFNFTPTKKLTLFARYYRVWKYSNKDVIYTTNMSKILINGTSETRADSKDYYKGFEVEAAFKLNKHISLDAQASFFTPGELINQLGYDENLKSLFFNCSYSF